MKLLAERLTWAMEEKSKRDGVIITAAGIARAADASDTAVSLWLNGGGISGKKARLVAAYLGVDPIWLENGEGKAGPNIKDKDRLSLVPSEDSGMVQYAKQVSELVYLFGTSTDIGRKLIFGAANDAPKIIGGNRAGMGSDDPQ